MTRGPLLAALLAVAVAAAVLAPAAAAGNNALAWSAPAAPHVCVEENTLEVAEHDRAAMSSPLQYYDDGGQLSRLPAHLSDGPNNSVGWIASHVDAAAFGEFPRSTDDGIDASNASVLDAAEWATTGPNASALSVTDSDGSAAPGVASVTVATDGTLGAGASATATYSGVSITSDAPKRVLLLVADVVTLEAGTEVQISAVDSDGDRKTVVINTSANADSTGVVATSAVDGVVGQVKLADLPTEGTGDGTFAAIESVEVTAVDGDATLRVVSLDVDRKAPITLGERMADSDGDGTLETVAVTEISAGGAVTYRSAGAADPALDGSTVRDLQVYEVRYCLSDLPSDRVSVAFAPTWTDSYNYPTGLQVRGRLKVPAAIDLSHTGLTVNMTQRRVSQRYVAVSHATGTGTTALSDVESWTDDSGALAAKGDAVTLLSAAPTGTNIDVRLRVLLKNGEAAALRPTVGGGGGPVGQSDGPLGWLVAGVMGAVAFLLARVRGLV